MVKKAVKIRLIEQFNQEWNATIYESNSCINYRMYKCDLQIEQYLLLLPPAQSRELIKFRLGNNRLPVITGQWESIPRENRTCPLCNNNSVADEYHYLFMCQSFREKRKQYLPVSKFTRPNCHKYKSLMGTTDKQILKNLSKFLKEILDTFSPL